jgi:group I intron endonuclease
MKRKCLGCPIEFEVTSKQLDKRFCTQRCWGNYQTEHKLNMKAELRNRPTVDEVKKAFSEQRTKLVQSLTFVEFALSGVYIIINIVNNMIYIGSSKDIEARWREHVHKFYGNRHENDKLQKAWNKYGEKAFQFRILEVVEEKDLVFREQYYLDLYKPYERHIGYNLYKTAFSPLGNVWTEEQKANLRVVRQNQKPRKLHCEWCKTVFIVKGQNAKFCSHKCRDKARWQKHKAKNQLGKQKTLKELFANLTDGELNVILEN